MDTVTVHRTSLDTSVTLDTRTGPVECRNVFASFGSEQHGTERREVITLRYDGRDIVLTEYDADALVNILKKLRPGKGK